MSLFENNETIVAPKLDDFVGEGKKYRDPDAVAKALVEKDNFIEQLKRETAELRNRPPVADRSQEILDRLEALNRVEPVTERQAITPAPERTEVKGLSEEDVFRLMGEREKQAKATTNINTVKAALREKYGENYPQALKSMAEKNGLGQNFLDRMAAESPQALLNLMATEKPEKMFTPPASVVQPGFVPTSGNPRTESYYEKLKTTDRKTYLSQPVQNQMMKDAMALKEAFYDIP